jgi:integrase
MTDIILKQDTRILFPEDYRKLRDQMPEYYKIICDAMLLSGMRPIEFERFDPSWYRASRRVIVLPKESCLKQKCKFQARTITLSLVGCDAFDRLTTTQVKFKGTMVSVLNMRSKRSAFNDALKRYAVLAGIGIDGITPKMFRKTLVSWIVAAYPEKGLYIQSSMGHDQGTIVNNYLGLGFTRDQIEDMKKNYLNEWGELV